MAVARPLDVGPNGKSTVNGSPRRQFFQLLRLKSIFHRQKNHKALKVFIPGGPKFEPLLKEKTSIRPKDENGNELNEMKKMIIRQPRLERTFPSRWRLFPLRIRSKFLCRAFTRRTLS